MTSGETGRKLSDDGGLRASVQRATHAYVGFCGCGCGAQVAASVDLPGERAFTARNLADFAKHGFRVERVLLEDATPLETCRQKTAQGSLPFA